MLETLPTLRDLLAGQQRLPLDMRANAVYVEFDTPVPEYRTGEFMRIRLTPEMLSGGASKFFRPEVYQTHRVKPQNCPGCRKIMREVAEHRWKCENPKCSNYRREHRAGPVRGVVRVLTFPDHIVEDPERGTLATACVVVLDRQYEDVVLAAVKRTCFDMVDQEWAGVQLR